VFAVDPSNLIRIMPAEGLRLSHPISDLPARASRFRIHVVRREQAMLRRAVLAAVFLVLTAGAPGTQAQDEQRILTVYTYSSFVSEYGPGPLVKDRFEKSCGCSLEWVASDDAGTLLSRLKLEEEMTEADVVLGLDTNLMAEAEATGLFQEHRIEAESLDLPVDWTNETFLPFDWGWFAFVYDQTRLKNPPTSLRALVEAEDRPAIVIQDPRTSTPGLGLLLWMREVYGDEAADAWKKLAPKIVTVTQGWSEAYGLFLQGEADMVLSYTTSPAYHLIAENEAKYKAAIFPEGHGLQVEVAGMIRTTDDAELAREFLAFMLSEPFQSAIPEGNWMYPVTSPTAGLPTVFAELPKPEKSLLTSPEDVEANRRAWIDEWLAAMSR
jgi:thiamine transport system substrate-binding protein